MRITKFVELDSVEVEVDVTIGDIVSQLPRTAENVKEVLRGMSAYLQFCNALPDELIAGLNHKQHEIMLEHVTNFQKRLSAIQPQPMSALEET